MVIDNGIKCDWCGKFIAYEDVENAEVKYTSETLFTSEQFEHKCENCKNGE